MDSCSRAASAPDLLPQTTTMPHASVTAPGVVSAFQHRVGLTPPALAELLGVPPRTLARYERHGGPQWLCYALAGIAGTVFDASESEFRALARLARGEGPAEGASTIEPPYG